MSENESSVMQFYDGELRDDISATGTKYLELIEEIRRDQHLGEAGNCDVLTEIRNRRERVDYDAAAAHDILDMIRARAKK